MEPYSVFIILVLAITVIWIPHCCSKQQLLLVVSTFSNTYWEIEIIMFVCSFCFIMAFASLYQFSQSLMQQYFQALFELLYLHHWLSFISIWLFCLTQILLFLGQRLTFSEKLNYKTFLSITCLGFGLLQQMQWWPISGFIFLFPNTGHIWKVKIEESSKLLFFSDHHWKSMNVCVSGLNESMQWVAWVK